MMEFGRPAKRKNTEKAGTKIITRGRPYLLRTGSAVGGSLLSGECIVIMSAQRDFCIIFFQGLFFGSGRLLIDDFEIFQRHILWHV